MAIGHSLSVASAVALEQVMTLPEDFKEAKYKAVRRQSLLNVEREKVLTEFKSKGIGYLPLKGIVIKNYYPKTAMREMADNDILCDEKNAEDIKEIMVSLGFTCKSFGKIHHDVYKKPPYLSFEIHRSLFEKTKDLEWFDYFEKLKQRQIKNDDDPLAYHLSDEDFYIYLIGHLFKHYKIMETGLRSLLDVYVFNKKHGEKLDYEYINTELKIIGLVEFEQVISGLAKKTFTNQTLSEEELVELRFFIDSNTHNTLDNLMMQKLGNDDSSKAKTKYAVSRLFPPRENLKQNHPFVYAHMGIYPMWILYRPIKGAVKHRKMMFNEIKRLKRFKKKENTGQFNK